MAVTDIRLSTMAKYCFWITTRPESLACLYRQNTREGHAGRLAGLASCHFLLYRLSKRKRRQHHCIAVLERSDRVCQIYITNVPSLAMEIFLAAMQRPFAELTDLIIFSSDEMVPVDPDSFLGGYVPRLEELVLDRISFPGLPKLILSASHLLYLMLQYSSFRVHFTRGYGHCPLHVDQPRITYA